jgi:hypothetical protein
MIAGSIARLPYPVRVWPLSYLLTFIPSTGTYAPGIFGSKSELWNFNPGDWNRDIFSACSADHFAFGNVFPQVMFHTPVNDVAKAVQVAFDLSSHPESPSFLHFNGLM